MGLTRNLTRNLTNSLTSGIVIPLNYFIFTVDTTRGGTGDPLVYIVPTQSTGTYDCRVDWGDGVVEDITTWNDPKWTHTYPSSGIYTVRISGTFAGWKQDFGGHWAKLTGILQFGILELIDGSNFHGCINLRIPATDFPNTSNKDDFTNFLRDCIGLQAGDFPGIKNLDVSNSNGPFSNAFLSTNFNPDIGDWNLTGGINANAMLNGAGALFNREINWTCQIIGGVSLFLSCSSFNRDVSNLDFTQSTNLNAAFNGTAFSTTNYDLLLISLVANGVQNNVPLGANNSSFTANALSVTSITRSGSTATVTTVSPHGLTTGNEIAVVGANQSEYNIVPTITVTGASTFTYTVAGTPTTPATGTISIYRAAAGIARQKLVVNNSWTITDNGAV